MTDRTDWDDRFLDLAEHVAAWSKDPSTKVGAVIVRADRTIASLGYNGFPRGVKDDPPLLLDREKKYPRTVHAELNAILTAKEPLSDCTIYIAPLHPCASCAGAIIQSGIRRVVARSRINGRWAESFAVAAAMFDEAGISVLVSNPDC